ncbi:hypothetical protein [Burkholderia multivorans]|uniref:hypothetical protein n=1 Tax=Burkholderia multivorans TaxID=87883 RepID=UPI0000E9AEE1|nr:hypothetical protein [Burkholderia multivorans]ABX15489.1 conserved hypothetical protein [Burkholderia multivorans ATCC 17616]
MANNNFKPFAAAAGANVMAQADYEALEALLTGFQSGTAQSAQLNKVWRQSSIMAAVLAQFICDRSGQNAIDDGTTATLLANLKLSSAALNGDATQTFSVSPATLNQHAVQRAQTVGNGAATLSTPNRVVGTTYTNSTGRPLFILLSLGSGNGNGESGSGFGLSINGAVVASLFGPITSGISISGTISAIVPVGATYVLNNTGLGVGFVGSWTEY